MSNEQNLKPFQKGNPGKPKGAKNKKTLAVQKLCQEILRVSPETGKKLTNAEFIRHMKAWALQSQTVAKHVLEHAHGKPTDNINVQGLTVIYGGNKPDTNKDTG